MNEIRSAGSTNFSDIHKCTSENSSSYWTESFTCSQSTVSFFPSRFGNGDPYVPVRFQIWRQGPPTRPSHLPAPSLQPRPATLFSGGKWHFWGVAKNCKISLDFTSIKLKFWINVEEKPRLLTVFSVFL